jgi:primosomal protein N'
MTEFAELLRAARERVCPFCTGGLTVRHNDVHYVLACTVCNSQMGSPDDCPNQETLRILAEEARLATSGQELIHRSVAERQPVAESYAELYG